MVGRGVVARTQTSFPGEGHSDSLTSQERGVLPVEQAWQQSRGITLVPSR